MNKQPTEYEVHFRIWYSYWLERMTETLNRRIDVSINAITITLGSAIFATSHFSWLFGGIIAVLSGFRIAWQYGQKAESAKQQVKRYSALIDDLPTITIDETRARLAMLEEFDSAALNSLCNPARNGASISLKHKHRETLSFAEKTISLLAGSTPR
ncbi:hypothetical protein WCT78_20115 [Pectobacterium versatile]|uniref:hypothetical protein n=1 Tax=Pectobacterium TaxID=122277 RepID=UPI000DE4019B|nr:MULTISPECIES: hypothetical protein [Pectobacterium]MBQ4791067.1 hypothetical protein [Pectobacterium versatile]QQA76191.1 hypothetical protein JBL47_00665 [Pectobacterium parmentieri]